MDLKQLEYIVQIAEEKNITKAAKKMYITQSALNQTLLKLEKEIGALLFKRTKLSLELTEIGELYVKQAKKIIEIKNETYEQIDELKEIYNSTIKIGLTPERGMLMFLSIYPIFHATFPNIKIEPLEANVEEQNKMLEEGRLDIGFVNVSETQKIKNKYQLIRKERLLLAVPVKFLSDITSDELGEIIEKIKEKEFVMLPQNTTIRKIVDEVLKKYDKALKILFESKNSSILIKMVEKELACTIISEIHMLKSEKIKYFYLGESCDLEYSVTYRENKYLSKPIKKFIELANKYWNS